MVNNVASASKVPQNWRVSGPPTLSDRDFRKISDYIYDVCGIKLPAIKKTMLSARLHKRLRRLNVHSFSEYFKYVLSPAGQQQELVHMIDAVSTNKTEFFREAKHFDVLTSKVLPEYVNMLRTRPTRKLHVWSAGCSSGEEPYTLAMVLEDFFSKHAALDYAILATDISTRVLNIAKEGIYSDDAVAPVPTLLRHKYLMRGKGKQKGFHRVVPELRNKVKFRRLNFMDRDFGIETPLDIIFCRNVIIYFDRKTQQELFGKFHRQLASHGHLFTGHSESLEGIIDKMERLESAVYRCLK